MSTLFIQHQYMLLGVERFSLIKKQKRWMRGCNTVKNINENGEKEWDRRNY